MDKLKIDEIIVVEGKDDISAVKKAVDCEILKTNGYSLNEIDQKLILQASKRKKIIIFTDSDYAGEVIRKRIEKLVGSENCKHAFLPKELSTKNNDIGIENGNPQDIIYALKKARCVIKKNSKDSFSFKDLVENGLVGNKNSAYKRNFIGNFLGIGYCNSKQFLSRLNNLNISKEEFNEAINEYNINKKGILNI